MFVFKGIKRNRYDMTLAFKKPLADKHEYSVAQICILLGIAE